MTIRLGRRFGLLALCLVALTLTAQAQNLPHTPYFDEIAQHLHWINRWREQNTELKNYVGMQDSRRSMSDDDWYCFDSLPEMKTYTNNDL